MKQEGSESWYLMLLDKQHMGTSPVQMTRQHAHAPVLIVRGLYYGTFLGWWRGLMHLWDPEVKMKLQFRAELNT